MMRTATPVQLANCRMAGTGSSREAKKQQATAASIGAAEPSGQPVSIQKAEQPAMAIATAMLDRNAIT